MGERELYDRDFFEITEQASRDSAQVIAPLVTRLVHPRSVVDIGCGAGTWLKAFQDAGVADILGVDGSYLDELPLMIPRQHFRARDLREPLDLGRRFDLAVSVEVAEHLPASRAESFVRDLVSLAPVVLFSAAIPFQGGVDHQNERWQDDWAGQFNANGYVAIDCVRRHVWTDQRVKWYYAQNSILYADRNRVAGDQAMAAEYEASRGWPLRIVHPEKYLAVADSSNIPLRRALGQLPRIAYHGLVRTARRLRR